MTLCSYYFILCFGFQISHRLQTNLYSLPNCCIHFKYSYTSLISNFFFDGSSERNCVCCNPFLLSFFHLTASILQHIYWSIYSWIHTVFIFLSLKIFIPLLHFLSYTDCAVFIISSLYIISVFKFFLFYISIHFYYHYVSYHIHIQIYFKNIFWLFICNFKYCVFLLLIARKSIVLLSNSPQLISANIRRIMDICMEWMKINYACLNFF